MALADTQRLLSTLELQDKFSGPAQAAGRSLGGLEQKSNFVQRGFGLMQRAAGGVGGAISTLKGRIGQLISGPLGMIGLGAGIFSVGKLLTDSIGQAQDFGKEVGRLALLTGLSTEATSKLAGAFQHFGIDTESALSIVGLAEKNIGKLTVTSGLASAQTSALAKAQRDLTLAEVKLNEVRAKRHTESQLLIATNRVADAQAKLNDLVAKGGAVAGGAAAFFKKYGLSIVDADGNVRDFDAQLLVSADFFNNKMIPAQKKAAALSTVYGKGWQTLIPILSAGRQGIIDAEAEVAKLGLTMSKEDLGALANLKKATREWGSALEGLKIQIGLALVPLLTKLTIGASNFLKSTDEFGRTGSQRIVGFFKDVIAFGEKAFGIIQDRFVPIVKQVIDGWNRLPEPLKNLLVKGAAGNFAIKFLLGFSPIGLAEQAAGVVAGKIAGVVAGRLAKSFGSFIGDFFGRTAAQKLIPQVIEAVTPIPVFVTNPGFGLPGGGGGTPVVPAAGGLLGALAIPLALLATSAVLLAQRSVRDGKDVTGDVSQGGARTPQSFVKDNTAAIKDNTDALKGKFKGQLPGAPGGGHPAAQLVKLDDAALIAALAKTSEFGFKGIGTTIEHGILAGTDPFGKQALALFQRAEFPRQGKTLGEIERHIIAAEDAQKQFAAKGDQNAVRQLQATIDGLRALLRGTDRVVNITQAEAQKRADTANRLNRLLDPLPGGIAALAAKDFSPTVNVRVTTNTSVSVSNVVRTVNSYTAAIGSGPGGAVANPY